MSEEKLMQLLEDLADGELTPEEVFEEVSWLIDFEEPYEGE